jgi:hypothetical protein
MTLSIIGGLLVLFILTGKMHKLANKGAALEVDEQVTVASRIQWICFLAGMVLMIAFGFTAAGTKTEETKPTPVSVTCVSSPPVAVAPANPSVVAPPPKPSIQIRKGGEGRY